MLEQAFNFFDQDEDGEICSEELAAVIKKDNPEISDSIINYMIEEVDTDGDGKVNLKEFKEMMLNKFEQQTQASEIFTEINLRRQTNMKGFKKQNTAQWWLN